MPLVRLASSLDCSASPPDPIQQSTTSQPFEEPRAKLRNKTLRWNRSYAVRGHAGISPAGSSSAPAQHTRCGYAGKRPIGIFPRSYRHRAFSYRTADVSAILRACARILVVMGAIPAHADDRAVHRQVRLGYVCLRHLFIQFAAPSNQLVKSNSCQCGILTGPYSFARPPGLGR